MMIVLIAAIRPACLRCFLLVLALEQADADPQQQRRADQLQVRQRQQVDREEGQDHAQHDRADAAEDDRLLLLLRRQRRQASAITTALSPTGRC
jgi:hypothetical protein